MAGDQDIQTVIRFGSFEADLQTQELRKRGRRLRLPGQSFQILKMLLERPGRLVTREELRTALWPSDTFVDFEHGLNAGVKRLREALADSADSPRLVETLPRRGYRFIGTITQNGNGPKGAAVLEEPAAIVPQAEVSKPLAQVNKPTWLARAAIVAALATITVATLWYTRPALPLPRITDTLQLTSDGRQKFGPLATDGVRVYFSEQVEDRWVIAAVPIMGGEAVAIHTPFPNASVLGMTSDRLGLLVGEGPLLEDHALWVLPILGGAPRRLANVEAHAASWSPDGQQLVFARQGDLFIAKADGSEPRQLTSSERNPLLWAWSPTWSPDARRLRFERYQMDKHTSSVLEIGVDGGKLHAVLPGSDSPEMACCGEWTPDGKYFVFQSWNGIESGLPWPAPNIWAIREAHGFLHKASGVPSQLTTGPIHFLGHVLSPDGKIIFTTSTFKRGELMQYDAKNRRLVPHLSGISADGLTYSIDGAWIAYVKFPQGELWRSRADGSEALQLTARPLVAYAPQWSPDGKQIVFDGQKAGEDWEIYVVSADGGPPKILPDSAQGYDPIWSPNGASILFARLAENHSRIERMDLKDQKVYEFPGSKQMGKARWSPDGRYLVAIREEPGKLARFDFKTGKWSEWAAAKQEIDWPTWSRDGKSLYFIGFSDPGVFRLGLQERTPVKILDLKDFRFAGTMGDWFSLTPDNKPLLLRSIGGGTEIYALHWDAP